MMRFLFIFLAFAVTLFSFGCRKELERPTWDADVLIPLAYSDVNLLDAVEDSLLNTSQNGELNLVYQSDLFSYKLDSLFNIPDTSTVELFSLPLGTVTAPPGQTIFSDTQENQYNLEDVELKLAIIRSGEIEFTLSHTVNEDLVFEYGLPYATLNGNPFFIQETVPAATSNTPSTLTKTYNLQGYEIDFTGTTGNSFNTLVSGFRVYVSTTGNPVTITAGDNVKIETNFKSITPQYARGYFGNRTVTVGPEYTSLQLFQNIPDGRIQLDKASLKVEMENELGIDFQAHINELKAVKNNQSIALQHAITQSAVNLSRANETSYQTSYSPNSYYTEINENNSNIVDFVGIFPDSLEYTIDLNVNPFGNISGGNDFVFYNSGITLSGSLEVPLTFNASNLLIRDTTEFNLENDAQAETDNIKGGKLWLRAENDYPFSAQVQMVTLNQNFEPLDTLVGTPDIIDAGVPTLNQKVENPTISRIAVPLNEEKIGLLYSTKHIVFLVTLNSNNSPSAPIFDHYNIRLKLIGDFNYRIDLNER